MDMIQMMNAQLAMMLFFALIPMLGMMQAQRAKIRIFMPEDNIGDTRRETSSRTGESL